LLRTKHTLDHQPSQEEPLHLFGVPSAIYTGISWGCSSVVEQRTFNPLVVGSNPTALTKFVQVISATLNDS
jgi:hypothetical protein